MKRIIIHLLLLNAALLGSLSVRAQATTQEPITILTYNIRHGAGMDNAMNLERQAAIIKACETDVVGLQEVDSVTNRSGMIDEAAYLAQENNMVGTFGRAIDFDGGKYGVAILSKENPLSVKNIPLPGAEPRTLLVCEFEQYVFACTHLDLEEANRLASVDIIVNEAKTWAKPFFLCGDWNDKPDSELLERMKESFTILNNTNAEDLLYPTYLSFPANEPTICLDYVAGFGQNFEKRSSEVLNEPEASDHRPVLVVASTNVFFSQHAHAGSYAY